MKQLVVITAEELRDAALDALLTKSAFQGKHVAAFEFVFDPDEPLLSRRVRVEAVLFDTAAAARRYMSGALNPLDEKPAGDSAAAPAGPDDADLEGSKTNG